MRPAITSFAAACVLLLGTACGGSSDGTTGSDAVPGDGRTLEELWRASGDDVAVVAGTANHEPGEVRFSFLVIDAEGQVVTLPTARIWVARELEAKPFLESSAKLERIGIPGGAEALAATRHASRPVLLLTRSSSGTPSRTPCGRASRSS